MIRALRAQILDQALQERHVVEPFTPPLPVDEPHDALEPQIGEARHGRGAQVRVGDAGESEAHPQAPSSAVRRGKGPRAIDRAATRLLERKDNPGLSPGLGASVTWPRRLEKG